jgi:acyl carrier protein
MRYLEEATTAARSLNLLDANDDIVPLDSLTSVDLVVELERLTELEIPTSALVPDVLGSLQAIARMLQAVAAERSEP